MLPIHYQGEDIYKGIRIRDTDTDELINLDDYLNVIVYLYTDSEAKLCYSRELYEEYYTLKKQTTTFYYLWIDSSITKDLKPGILTMEIKVVKTESDLTDGKEDLIAISEVAEIRPSQIKSDDALNQTWTINIAGDTYNQLSGMALNNISSANTDDYKLYWELHNYYGDKKLTLFTDSAHTTGVASGHSGNIADTLIITELNDSGITGSVVMAYTQNDEDAANIIYLT